MLRTVTIFLSLIYLLICQSAHAVEFKKIPANDLHPEIWYMPTKTIPTISLEVSFPIGSVFDPDKKLGLANFVAATLDEGAGALQTDDFHQALTDQQISLYYKASGNHITLKMNFLKFDLPKAVELAKLSLEAPRFDAEPVELMRKKLMDNVVKSQQSSSYIASRYLDQYYYQDHPFSKPSGGLMSTLKNITKKDLQGFHQKLSHKGAFISVVGDISKAEILALSQDLFANIPKQSQFAPQIPQFDQQPKPHKAHIYYDVPQTTILMATPAVKRNSPEFFATYIAAHILGGGGFSSYLIKNLREKKGLTYAAGAYLNSSLYDGRMMIQFATDNAKVKEAVDAAQKTLQDLGKNGITQQEFKQAKLLLKGRYAIAFETNSDIAALAQGLYHSDLTYDYPQQRLALFDAVTLKQVNDAMQKIFLQPLTMVLIGGNKYIEGFENVNIQNLQF